MSNARNLANLLGGSTTISIESLSADIPITEKFTTTAQLPVTATIGEQAFVEETNRLYIWNGSGWYNIALINTNPNITSDHDSSYTLSYGTPLNISVDAVDPEGLNLNYSYYTSDSIGNVATITNDSSEFTITPSSDYSVEGTFGLVFRASDGVNLATSGTSNFTLANQAPSLSGNSASYILSDDGSTPIIINLTSVDPEGQPITYTATGDSGFNAIATVSNDSSVFTITPKSADSAVSGTGTLTFTASDGIKSTNAASSFSLSFVSVITDSKYTTLLATATDTSDNNNITDASSNNHTITVSGDAHAGTFSPYRSGGYSGLFDSTSVVQLSFAGSSDFEFGTGNFTIEMWFKWNSSNKPETTIFSNRISGSTFNTGKYFLKLMPGDTTSGGIEFAFDCGTPRYRLYCVGNLTADNAFFDEGWHHYAAVRNGTSLKLFVDGQEVDEITLPANETNFGSSSDNIGLGINNSVSSPTGPDGEYRDVRIVKGVAITPPSGGPTESLDAVSGTTLLLYNGEGYLKDKSTSNHSPIYGSTVPTITATGPRDYGEYSATDHGGSVYFVGGANFSSQYLSLSGPTMPSGDFTLSTWAYLTSNGSDTTLIDFNGNSGGFRIMYVSNSNGGYHFRFYTAGGTVYLYDQNIDHHHNQWYYIVVVRDSGTFKLYVNNILIGTSTATPTFSSSTNVRIGQMISGYDTLEGYLSDIRYNPTTAITDFTPPTAPLSSSGTSLHIKGTDASIIDKSQSANLKLEGSVDNGWGLDKFITSQQAVKFNGSTQYLTVAGSSDFDFGSNDFTIEAWVYTDSSNEQVITSGRPSGSSWIFLDKTSSNTIRILISTNGSSWAVNSTSTETMTLGRWNHISVSRDGSTINMYLNGRLIISTSITGSIHYNTSEEISIGSGQNDSADRTWNGYISDFRIINGTAVVPPVNGPNEALTEVTNTKLLTCRPSGASITDLSTTGTTHTIVSVGSTAAAYANPFGKAMHFDSVDDLINLNGVLDLSQACTWEAWVYFDNHSTASGFMHMFQSASYSSTDPPFGIRFKTTGGMKINFVLYTTSGNHEVQSPNAISLDTWYHLAFSRTSSGVYNVYIDGTRYSTFTESATYQSAGDVMVIGNSGTGSTAARYLDGYMQDIRITQGLARYTAADESSNIPTAPLEG